MQDLQREIVSQVAAGKISAEEGAARLEALGSGESPTPAQPVRAAEPAPAAVSGTRRIRVMSMIGSADIVGDPSVTTAVAEGAHQARQDGDALVIEQAPLEESNHFASNHFTFSRGEQRIVLNGLDFQRRRLKVRMNPELALTATLNAGSLRIEGVHGPISGEVLAGSCRISGFRGPLDMAVQAGNLDARGRLDSGESKIRCEMGSASIALEPGSSVRIAAHTTMGKVAISSGGAEQVMIGQTGKEVRIGSGAASLEIDCTMGNVRVSA